MLDLTLLVFSALSSFALACLGFWLPRNRLVARACFVAVGIISLVSIIWGGIRSSAVQDAIRQGVEQTLQIVKGIPPTKPIETSVHIECLEGLMADTAPPDGKIWFLMLSPLPGTMRLQYFFGTPGTTIGLPKDEGHPLLAERCQLTNYGEVPIFDVKISALVAFKEVLADKDNPGVSREGGVTLSRNTPIEVQKLDAGPDHAFTFYIFNLEPQFVEISFPQSATYRLASDRAQHETPLLQSTTPPMIFSPFVETKP